MTVTKLQETGTIESKNEQISQLESEINRRSADIQNLTEAIATLKSGKPRPSNPDADNVFKLLKELIGSVPQNLEHQAIYQAKLTESERSLELAIAACREKQTELKNLRALKSTQQEQEAFEQLKNKATEFNNLIDGAMSVLDEMRGLSLVRSRFEILPDLREMPFCSISENFVKVRRRVDVLRG